MVFFRRSDVISAGDILNTNRYPRFDPERGGGIDGIIEGLNLILDIAIAGENQEGGTVVVPGHGRLGDETDVVNYRDMVTIVRERVVALVDEGKTLEEVQAARPTFDYDGSYSNESIGWTGDDFVEAVYNDLKRTESHDHRSAEELVAHAAFFGRGRLRRRPVLAARSAVAAA